MVSSNVFGVQPRANAAMGWWLVFLLPSSLILSVSTQPVISTPTYKLSSLYSIGVIFTSLLVLAKISSCRLLEMNRSLTIAAWFANGLLFRLCLHKDWVFCICSAFQATVLYQRLFLMILQKLPKCFTFGEAALCSQSFSLLLYHTFVNLLYNFPKTTISDVQMSTLTIQLGLIALAVIVVLTSQLKFTTPWKFYLLTVIVFTLVVLMPFQLIFKRNSLLWILHLLGEDLKRNKVVLSWVLCSVLAVVVVNKKIRQAQKASTSVRKSFHLLLAVVYILGLLHNCSLLYLASGVVLGIFFMLEILRVLNMPPLGTHLQDGLTIFGDDRDAGIIAFTPMYLLAGCSLPLWIHPAPCDVTNSATFDLLPLLSGVLTIGIGDSAASIVGSKYGKWRWQGSNKTVEGTIAYVLSQLFVVSALVSCDVLRLSTMQEQYKVVAAVITTSLIEAKTDQIDNLVLPFVMYMIFMF